MTRTCRIAATQVNYTWDDSGGNVNPYSPDFKAKALDAHIESNIRQQLDLFERAGEMGADLAVGAEDLQRLGHFGTYLDDTSFFRKRVERIPGPTSKRVAAVARKHRMHIVACYPEKAGSKYYNSAVLFDRRGRIVGKYRKVQLPSGETWVYAAGETFPVFRTDMGNVGMMICYDLFFPEIARCLALNGADIICCPTMGYGWTENIGDATAKSRAVDNGVTLVLACGMRSQVVNHWGEVLCDAGHRRNVVVTADLDPTEPPLHPENHYASIQSTIRDVRERWTKERQVGAFKVLSSPNPPLMRRYSKKAKVPSTGAEIRPVYEKIKAEHERVARGKSARYRWGM